MPYRKLFAELLPRVEEVFDLSQNLTALRAETFVGRPDLIDPARYLTAPPVSQDDLRTLCGGFVRCRTRSEAEKIAKVITAGLDQDRYPWLSAGRAASTQEVAAAQKWTASIWAIEKSRTKRRTDAGRRQEDAIKAMLPQLGFRLSETAHEKIDNAGKPLRDIRSADAIRRGSFRNEIAVAGTKADIPVRLHDGRLLAIECKESNSAINSTKRLNRETGGKAAKWNTEFGVQVVTMAVIAGVYHIKDLLTAQNELNVFVVWEHDLTPLADFLRAAK